MLKISTAQIESMQIAIQRKFEDETASHIRRFAPRRCGEISDEVLRLAVQKSIHRANEYGFTKKGPVRLFLEAMLLFGCDFDNDPQYLTLSSQLSTEGEQMDRAKLLYNEILAYQSAVLGNDDGNLLNALPALLLLTTNNGTWADDFDASLLQTLSSVFPQKAAYAGMDGLQKLIQCGREEAKLHNLLGTHTQAVMAIAMFVFGRGIAHDWSYPAVRQSLAVPPPTMTSTSAERFESEIRSLLNKSLGTVSKVKQ